MYSIHTLCLIHSRLCTSACLRWISVPQLFLSMIFSYFLFSRLATTESFIFCRSFIPTYLLHPNIFFTFIYFNLLPLFLFAISSSNNAFKMHEPGFPVSYAYTLIKFSPFIVNLTASILHPFLFRSKVLL